MIIQILGIFGIISPILYTLAWIIIGSIQPGYSHIKDDISSLFAVGAPYKRLMQSLNIISSGSLLAFSLGLHVGIPGGAGSIFGPLLFSISCLLGFLVTLFFPLDEGGEITTYKGKLHLILVVLTGILNIIVMVVLGFRLLPIPGWDALAWILFILAGVSLFLVVLSGKYAKSKYMGLVERLMVTPYQLFYFFLGLVVFLNN
ncbi:MAG: DUF998 domain-containing protein [Candidatus Hodarchaeota archaeon]